MFNIDGDSKSDPKHLDWKTYNGRLLPIMTDLQPGPGILLKKIRCTFTVCNLYRCSCMLHGLEFHLGCTECKRLQPYRIHKPLICVTTIDCVNKRQMKACVMSKLLFQMLDADVVVFLLLSAFILSYLIYTDHMFQYHHIPIILL